MKPTRQQLIAAIEPHLAAERTMLARIERGEDIAYAECPNADLNGTWDMPEFGEARRLTGELEMVWDFGGWREALNCIEGGKLGGVTI